MNKKNYSEKTAKNGIILLSGGLDSYVALDIATKKSVKISLALTFDYGQKPFKDELFAAKQIAKKYKIKHKTLKLPFLKKMTGENIWVPNRNGLFINIAGCFCDKMGLDYIIFGANATEATNFPDNSVDFIKVANKSLKFSTKNSAKFLETTEKMTKKEIVEYAISNDLDFSIIKSCYDVKIGKNGQKIRNCGVCESCKLLKQALLSLKREDLFEQLGF